jgi:hypothetical protein
MREKDKVISWLCDKYEMTGRREDEILVSAAYTECSEWIGEEMTITHMRFSKDMRRAWIGIKIMHGKRYYYGIRKRVIE